LALKAYEEDVLSGMYDRQIIGHAHYLPIETVASIIKWSDIARKHRVRKSFKRVARKLHSKGYIDFHGKKGDVASLSELGVAYVVGRRQET